MNNKQRAYRCFDILGECMLDIKAVLFDCDGLMFETELISQQIWKDEANKLGFSLPEDFFINITGSGGE